MRHTLSRSNGGLIIARNNDIREKIIQLYRQALYPQWVRGESITHQGRRRSEEGVHHGSIIPETLGDVLIRDLWEIQMDTTIGIRFRDADTETYVK